MTQTDQMSYQYTLDADEVPSEGVYSVIAALKDCSPLDLDPLAEAVDPDALDVLLIENNQQRISFQYSGYEVTATPTEIQVREPGNK